VPARVEAAAAAGLDPTGQFLITAANMNEPEMQKLIKPPLDEYLK